MPSLHKLIGVQGIQALNGAQLPPLSSMLIKFDSTLTVPSGQDTTIPVLIDSESTSEFVSLATVQKLKVPTVPMKSPLPVITIDSQILKAGSIAHATMPLKLIIDQHSEELTFFVADHIDLPIVLGTT